MKTISELEKDREILRAELNELSVRHEQVRQEMYAIRTLIDEKSQTETDLINFIFLSKKFWA